MYPSQGEMKPAISVGGRTSTAHNPTAYEWEPPAVDCPACAREPYGFSRGRISDDSQTKSHPIYTWNRRNTTPFTAWIRAVTAAIPERFCSKTAHLYVSA